MRPKVSFDSMDIWRRLQTCQTVALAYGWQSTEISRFTDEVRQAFSYEEAMAIIDRHFDTRARQIDADRLPLFPDPNIYRQEAGRLRRAADSPEHAPICDEILGIANQFDRLAESIEQLGGSLSSPRPGSGSNPRQT